MTLRQGFHDSGSFVGLPARAAPTHKPLTATHELTPNTTIRSRPQGGSCGVCASFNHVVSPENGLNFE
ncbi:hypothetical protein CEXT_98081 [Caerostris extrusa]|uniref:Uncharacterized protein n=1 Tax=Caerostris extrusa TaxID=172846 RepID=A0AAV4XZN4_CAEEX|nr:hypothetical protein CEXT_98081 [Caerostris extrusa]